MSIMRVRLLITTGAMAVTKATSKEGRDKMQMPSDANIPFEWQLGGDTNQLVIVVPSWSQTEKTSYAVFMDKKTRELKCECKGFQIRGDCHHVRGLAWFCKKPRGKGVQKTSLEAYRALTAEALGERQKLVFKALETMGRASDKELSFALGWPINTITPRRGELEEMGIIECVGEQLDAKTERNEMIWAVA